MNLKSILVLIFVPIYGVLCWKYYVCSIKNLCSDETANTQQNEVIEPIRFYKNSVNFELGSFETYADSLFVLAQNKHLEIVGYYGNDELNTSEYENLGLARANELKQLLIHRGLDSNKIGIYSKIYELVFKDSLAISTQVDTAISLNMDSEDVQLITHHGITEIYFPTNSKNEIRSAILDEFLKNLVQTSIDKKIQLVGHTDNIGSEEANLNLSLKRTNTIRDQLVKLGMPISNIDCQGKGSSSPKVNNSTEENRALNRRVEVIVQ
jgi:OOP family OmpA-OmpF porin